MSMYNGPITHLHFEPTSECNARCPQCLRTYHQSLETHPLLDIRHWNPQDLGRVLDDPLFANVVEVLVNGNFGEISMHPQPREILSQFLDRDIFMVVDTNGSAQRPDFWTWYGQHKRVITLFALDGLEDTHGLYRRKTNYHTILRNARAYIEAGGNATWVMTVFKHNQHQVDECRELARKMGFTNFLARPSTRYAESKMAVVDEKFETSFYLESVQDKPVGPYGFKAEQYKWGKTNYAEAFGRDDYQLINAHKAEISCRATNGSTAYLSFDQRLWPCCWTASGFETHLKGTQGNTTFDLYADAYAEDPDFNNVVKYSPSIVFERLAGFQRIVDAMNTDKPCTSCFWACQKDSEFAVMQAKEVEQRLTDAPRERPPSTTV